MQVRSLGREDSLEKKLATHWGILAGAVPWSLGGGRQPTGSQRAGHDWATQQQLLPRGFSCNSINTQGISCWLFKLVIISCLNPSSSHKLPGVHLTRIPRDNQVSQPRSPDASPRTPQHYCTRLKFYLKERGGGRRLAKGRASRKSSSEILSGGVRDEAQVP